MGKMTTEAKHSAFGVLGRLYGTSVGVAELVPYWLISLAARLGVGMVFWKSGQTKITSDFEIAPSAYMLFQNEYFPYLNEGLVDVLTVLGTITEIVCSLLLMLGMLSRLNALALLGVTAVIQFLVFTDLSKLADFSNPFQAWHVHMLWAAALLLILARGPGAVSVDHIVSRFLGKGGSIKV
jgi:putative oxidoreductase